MTVPTDIAGQRFGLLSVLAQHSERSKDGQVRWYCLCRCGTMSVMRSYNIRKGLNVSCGCYGRSQLAGANRTHGCSTNRTPEYRSWLAAKERCFNPHCDNYVEYGGRGITMCAEWASNFQAFLDHIGPRPIGTTLDRIDVHGHYAPGNVRWATATMQRSNQRRAAPQTSMSAD